MIQSPSFSVNKPISNSSYQNNAYKNFKLPEKSDTVTISKPEQNTVEETKEAPAEIISNTQINSNEDISNKTENKQLKEAAKKLLVSTGAIVLSCLLSYSLICLLLKSGKAGGKSPAEGLIDIENYKNDDSIVTLDKLPGMTEVKEEIRKKIILPIQNASIFQKEGMKPASGIILWGPPGTGKTNVIKSLAKTLDANVVQFSISRDGSPYVNQASINLRKKAQKLIELAESNPDKQYFVLFDEIESIISETSNMESGGALARQEIIKTFLQMLDDFKNKPNIHVFATTNTLLEVQSGAMGNMNPAALSRLATKIYVGNPDADAIMGAIKLHLSKSELSEEFLKDEELLKEISKELVGYSYRDIENIVKTAQENLIYTTFEKKPNAKMTKEIFRGAMEAFKKIKDPNAQHQERTISEGEIYSILDKFMKQFSRAE